MRHSSVLLAFFLIASCVPAASKNPAAVISTTYFTYDLSTLPTFPEIDGLQPIEPAQPIAWDTRLIDIARRYRLSPPEAARLFAAVAIAQNDGVKLGIHENGFDAIGAQVACDLVPATCPELLPLVQNNRYDLELATVIVSKFHERTAADVSTGQDPMLTGSGAWSTATAPLSPDAGGWRPWSADDLIGIPAPWKTGSPEEAEQLRLTLDAVRSITPVTRARALHWTPNRNGKTAPGLWLAVLDDLLTEHPLPIERVTAIRAAVTAAMADALIETWHAKFSYRTDWPSHRDTRIAPVITIIPEVPSYPSIQGGVSAAATAILEHAFPDRAAWLLEQGREARDSEVKIGINTPEDAVRSADVGSSIGTRVLDDSRFGF